MCGYEVVLLLRSPCSWCIDIIALSTGVRPGFLEFECVWLYKLSDAEVAKHTTNAHAHID